MNAPGSDVIAMIEADDGKSETTEAGTITGDDQLLGTETVSGT
jgi:hypothetical protein